MQSGTHTVSYSARDAAGNVSNVCSFTVTVNDTEEPVVSGCPADIVQDNDAGLCSAVVSWTEPTAADNCTAAGSLVWTKSHLPGSVFAVGTHTVSYSARDAAGNVSNVCSFTVTVNDTEEPVVSGCPADIVQDNDAGLCSAVVSWTEPTAADNCTAAGSLVWTKSHLPGSVFAVGTHTVSYSARDAAGNVSNVCSFTVTVNDTEEPVVSGCPADIVQDNDAGLCSAVVSWTEPTAADNCTAAGSLVWTKSHLPGSVFAVGTHTVSYSARDAAGNVSNVCSFTVTVNDTEEPVVSGCPADIVQDNDAGLCSAVVSWTEPTAADNCTAAGSLVWTKSHLPGSVFAVGTHTVSYSARDAAGNVSNVCSFTVTVNDTEEPVVSGCPADIVQDNDAGLCSAVVSWTEPTAADNCTAAGSLVWTKSHLPGSVFAVGTHTVSYSARDAAGNVSNVCSFTVTVNDTEEPAAICKNISISLDLITGIQTITTADINNSSSDNCGIASISASKTDFDCTNVGANNVTLTVTDIHGNISSCNAIVTVNYSVTPDPVVAPLSAVICNGGTTNFALTNNIPGTTWTWIVTAPPQISGESDDLTGTKASIQQTLVNSDNIAYKVVYTIFPRIYNSCSLAPITAEVWVEPTPRATIGTTTPVICNGSNINVTINSPTVSTQPDNLSYVVTLSSTDPGHLGGTAIAGFTKLKSELPHSITGTLTNSGDAPIVVTYTVTPRLNGCSDGPVQTVTVSVNPTPQVFPSSVAQTICNDGPVSVLLSSPSTFTSGEISFNYTVTATGLVTGFSPAGTWPKDHTISDVLHNPTDVPQEVTYTIVPVSPNGCAAGSSQDYSNYSRPDTPGCTGCFEPDDV